MSEPSLPSTRRVPISDCNSLTRTLKYSRVSSLRAPKLSAFFADNFGARKLLTREYFRVRVKLLQSDIGTRLVLGKDGSLILNGEIPSSRHLYRIEPQRLERIRRLLNSWC